MCAWSRLADVIRVSNADRCAQQRTEGMKRFGERFFFISTSRIDDIGK